MMTITLLLSLILLLFPSCSPESTIKERDIYLVTVADDFYSSTSERNTLKTVVTDQAAIISQISTLSDNVHIYAFTSQNGKRYYSTHPKFEPVDQKGNKVDASSSLFDHFNYIAESAESTEDWTMNTVLEKIGTIVSSSDDLIIFTYSGHGENGTGDFITNANHDPYITTNKQAVFDVFAELPGKKVFFLDSCYSGNFINSSSFVTKDTFSSDEDKYTGEDTLTAVKTSSLEKTAMTQENFWIMASAGKNQAASDSLSAGDSTVQSHYGAFTYYLLKALGYDMDTNEAKKDTSSLTFYGIYSYIRSAFPSSELDIQTPRVSLKRLDIRLR